MRRKRWSENKDRIPPLAFSVGSGLIWSDSDLSFFIYIVCWDSFICTWHDRGWVLVWNLGYFPFFLLGNGELDEGGGSERGVMGVKERGWAGPGWIG